MSYSNTHMPMNLGDGHKSGDSVEDAVDRHVYEGGSKRLPTPSSGETTTTKEKKLPVPPPPPLPPSPPPLDSRLAFQEQKCNSSSPPYPDPPNADSDLSSIRSYLASGRRLPLVVLTCNRAAYLTKTLESLLSVRGVEKRDILVVQDGKHAETENVVKDFELKLVQNVGGTNLRRGSPTDGAARIATHYKFALTEGFKWRGESPALIVVEDDFLFSPDFLEYFESSGPILEDDPTTFILSAWNDNRLDVHVRDKSKLLRTSYFPGLGWMLTRALWEKELACRWPKTHWDHWMRDPARHKGRDCIYPEVPRDYHIGVKGTFIDDFHHSHYFKDIGYNKEASFSWTGDEYKSAMKSSYDKDLEDRIDSAAELNSLAELQSARGKSFKIFIDIKPMGRGQQPFKKIASYFAIWHELERANYKGVHRFGWDNENYVYIVNEAEANCRFPRKGKSWNPADFQVEKKMNKRK